MVSNNANFSIGEFLKYSLSSPVRMGKAWLGVIVYGLILYAMLQGFILLYVYVFDVFLGPEAIKTDFSKVLYGTLGLKFLCFLTSFIIISASRLSYC